MNLVINARGALPEGGQICIETRDVLLDAEFAARYVDVKPGRYVVLTVTDNGVGMDEETRKRIFEPFFSTQVRGRGTGLGLSTAHGIVQQSGGRIQVYSELGVGSSFKVYLPSTAAPLDGVDGPERHGVQAAAGQTLLVVEDEAALLRVVSRVLERSGYTVLAAASAERALEIFEERGAEVNLLLTDVILPGMDGRKLAKELYTRSDALSVLYMSGYTANAIARHGVLEPDVEFIHKPFTAHEITTRVSEILTAAAKGSRAKAV